MNTQKKPHHYRLAIIIAATLTGGTLATAVTHQALSRRAILETEDGKVYEVELLESREGASGSFFSDDGTEYHVNVLDNAAAGRAISVDVDGPASGEVSVGISDDPYTMLARKRAPGYERDDQAETEEERQKDKN